MKIRAKHRQFNFPYLYDGETEEVSRAFGPRPRHTRSSSTRNANSVIPTHRRRRARHEHHVTRPAQRPRRAAGGREVEVKQTKTFGCSIKWAGKEDSVKRFLDKLAAEPVSVDFVEAEGLKALRKNDSGKLRLVNSGPRGAALSHRVSRPRHHQPHVSPSRLRDGDGGGELSDEQKEALVFLKKQQASGRNLIFGQSCQIQMMEAFDPDWNGALPNTVLSVPPAKSSSDSRAPSTTWS